MFKSIYVNNYVKQPTASHTSLAVLFIYHARIRKKYISTCSILNVFQENSVKCSLILKKTVHQLCISGSQLRIQFSFSIVPKKMVFVNFKSSTVFHILNTCFQFVYMRFILCSNKNICYIPPSWRDSVDNTARYLFQLNINKVYGYSV